MILLVIRITDDECKFSFWYIEVSAYYAHNLVYFCCSLPAQTNRTDLNISARHEPDKALYESKSK